MSDKYVIDEKAYEAAAPKAGRPSLYTPDIIEYICERIGEGQSLRSICNDPNVPGRRTVLDWLADDSKEEFRTKYARACEARKELLVDELIEIADDECTMVKRSKHGGDDDDGDIEVVFDPTAVARNKLRIETRKWMLEKLDPKKYGSKVTQEHTGKDGGPIQTKADVTLSPDEAYMRLIGK